MKIFDLHCDTFCEIFDKRTTLDDTSLAVNTVELARFETVIVNFAVFLHPEIIDSAYRYTEVLSYGKECLSKANVVPCTSVASLKGEGIKALLSVEGGVPNFSPYFVEKLQLDGVRTVSLTWNYDNPLAGGAFGDGGLTPLGVDVIKELNRFKMAVDLSHLNQKSFFEVIDKADICLATHLGVFSTVKHKRNLTDEQFRAIKYKNGIVGLTVYPEFIGNDPYEGFYNAVIHCLELGLEDNLSLGTDFDGAIMHKSLSNTMHLNVLKDYLTDKNIPEGVLNKIFFENSDNFYNRVLTNFTL